MPLLTSEAIESALGAVIERTNSTGALCHEETVGDYASFVNMGNNRSDLGNQPYYDYKYVSLNPDDRATIYPNGSADFSEPRSTG